VLRGSGDYVVWWYSYVEFSSVALGFRKVRYGNVTCYWEGIVCITKFSASH
jgi:hypothetical protein